MPLQTLPTEIIELICAHLCYIDRKALCRTGKVMQIKLDVSIQPLDSPAFIKILLVPFRSEMTDLPCSGVQQLQIDFHLLRTQHYTPTTVIALTSLP